MASMYDTTSITCRMPPPCCSVASTTRHQFAYKTHRIDHARYGLACSVDPYRPFFHAGSRMLDQVANVPRSRGAPLCEVAHLGCDHSEAAALLTRPEQLPPPH